MRVIDELGVEYLCEELRQRGELGERDGLGFEEGCLFEVEVEVEIFALSEEAIGLFTDLIAMYTQAFISTFHYVMIDSTTRQHVEITAENQGDLIVHAFIFAS